METLSRHEPLCRSPSVAESAGGKPLAHSIKRQDLGHRIEGLDGAWLAAQGGSQWH
jgi:hypothetical protein